MPESMRYFAGVSGYTTPPKLEKEIKYIDTQKRNAYYVSLISPDGKILHLEKYILDREKVAEPITGWNPHGRHQSTTRFFSFKTITRDGVLTLHIEKEIFLDETEPLMEYLVITEAADGKIEDKQKISKKLFFRHSYSYWVNGKIKEWKHRQGDGADLVTHFDPQGKRIDDPQ